MSILVGAYESIMNSMYILCMVFKHMQIMLVTCCVCKITTCRLCCVAFNIVYSVYICVL